jgi:antitoxin CptB
MNAALTINDPRRLDRLRWKARRGLLENDLILTKFLEKDLENLSEAELSTLDQLLQLGDNDLLDVLMGRATNTIKIDAATAALVTKILNA